MNFIKGVFHEMKMTTWPTWKENRRDTTTVIITSIIFAVYFALCDWAITAILEKFVF
ncbi:preprotein translocase subunit SecE [Lacticaseibacillus pantheris]|jgi:preprotein translocase subunit SecE|uniref:Protein translocase subunit SecE n=2 Tax=Lacticaseibacillus pantheris TaxID=171523 RepID=A0A0R1U0U4_9LACO|nr:preprotein translocase subunit SecE [Lacticaseibacillus pantheris]KRL87025.1 hypothetical protein FC50_GL000226 [Lacticaseibacillus pantheris DSM 15945 = JCM 12539 = NBRC 106106]WKF85953.1 preprotein translocase subunit SecE [Lacticaseibacillus pantheris]